MTETQHLIYSLGYPSFADSGQSVDYVGWSIINDSGQVAGNHQNTQDDSNWTPRCAQKNKSFDVSTLSSNLGKTGYVSNSENAYMSYLSFRYGSYADGQVSNANDCLGRIGGINWSNVSLVNASLELDFRAKGAAAGKTFTLYYRDISTGTPSTVAIDSLYFPMAYGKTVTSTIDASNISKLHDFLKMSANCDIDNRDRRADTLFLYNAKAATNTSYSVGYSIFERAILHINYITDSTVFTISNYYPNENSTNLLTGIVGYQNFYLNTNGWTVDGGVVKNASFSYNGSTITMNPNTGLTNVTFAAGNNPYSFNFNSTAGASYTPDTASKRILGVESGLTTGSFQCTRGFYNDANVTPWNTDTENGNSVMVVASAYQSNSQCRSNANITLTCTGQSSNTQALSWYSNPTSNTIVHYFKNIPAFDRNESVEVGGYVYDISGANVRYTSVIYSGDTGNAPVMHFRADGNGIALGKKYEGSNAGELQLGFNINYSNSFNTISLSSSGWTSSSKSQTIYTNEYIHKNITSSSYILVSPSPSYFSEYTNAGIYCYSISGTNQLTFKYTADDKPTSSIGVQVLVL